MEVDIDVGSSSVAAAVVGLVQGATRSLVVDMGIVLEGHSRGAGRPRPLRRVRAQGVGPLGHWSAACHGAAPARQTDCLSEGARCCCQTGEAEGFLNTPPGQPLACTQRAPKSVQRRHESDAWTCGPKMNEARKK